MAGNMQQLYPRKLGLIKKKGIVSKIEIKYDIFN